MLERRSPVLHLIQRIRDESHRFAIAYHRKRREIRDRSSELMEIAGVGARTRIRLVEHFGSVRSVEAAGVEALTAVVPRKTAELIYAYFRRDVSAGEPSEAVQVSQALPPILPN